MSQNSYPDHNYEHEKLNEKENEEKNYYGETFKQARETSSTTPNVFSQNLGFTAGASTNYECNYGDEERREYIREVVNREEDYQDEENQDEENVHVSVKDLEIFEDKSNHIEELNDDVENVYCQGENSEKV